MSSFEERFPKTRLLLNSALGDVFPAYAVGVSHHGRNFYAHQRCGSHSLFDLASLTKVLCTTTVTLLAEQKGIISLDTPVRDLLPKFPDARVRLSHLLDHTSGLPAWLPLHSHFHEEGGLGAFHPLTTPPAAREWYEEQIASSWVSGDFEKKTTYSDLGFMLLGWALEKATKLPIDALFQEWFILETKAKSLQFLPTSPDVLPTENCPWRKRVLRGEVHDDNCYVLGGVSAHAGLFGDIYDVIRVGEYWLTANRNAHPGSELLNPDLVRKYWSFTHLATSVRSLGWDGVTPEGSSTGKSFSPRSRGHLGYTGTSLWIDPDADLIVALLTNRVHPSRTNEKIKAFRPQFHDSLRAEL